MTRSG